MLDWTIGFIGYGSSVEDQTIFMLTMILLMIE